MHYSVTFKRRIKLDLICKCVELYISIAMLFPINFKQQQKLLLQFDFIHLNVEIGLY